MSDKSSILNWLHMILNFFILSYSFLDLRRRMDMQINTLSGGDYNGFFFSLHFTMENNLWLENMRTEMNRKIICHF